MISERSSDQAFMRRTDRSFVSALGSTTCGPVTGVGRHGERMIESAMVFEAQRTYLGAKMVRRKHVGMIDLPPLFHSVISQKSLTKHETRDQALPWHTLAWVNFPILQQV